MYGKPYRSPSKPAPEPVPEYTPKEPEYKPPPPSYKPEPEPPVKACLTFKLFTHLADLAFFILTTVALATNYWITMLLPAAGPSNDPSYGSYGSYGSYASYNPAPTPLVDSRLGLWEQCQKDVSNTEVCEDVENTTDVKVAKGCLIVAILLVPFAILMTCKEKGPKKWIGISLRIVIVALSAGGGYNWLTETWDSLDDTYASIGYSSGCHSAGVALYIALCFMMVVRACCGKPAPKPVPRPYPKPDDKPGHYGDSVPASNVEAYLQDNGY
jgi:hypothetical protein